MKNLPSPMVDAQILQDRILPVLVRSRAQSTPHFVCVKEVAGATSTYSELNRASQGFGTYFQELGVRQGEVVATFLDASIVALEVWMGLCWAGATEAALNTGYRHQLLADVLNDTRSQTVVTTTGFLPVLLEVAGSLDFVERIVLLDTDSVPVSAHGAWKLIPARKAREWVAVAENLIEPDLETASCILYTSGTTGPSKGVVLPWAQMLETGRTIIPIQHMQNSDVFYSPYAPCHITGKAYFYSMTLLGGGYVIKKQFRTAEFWPDVRAYNCTTTLLQGAMAHFLWNQKATDEDALTPMTQVIIAPVIAEVDAFEERFGVKVGTAYNMTELSCPLVSDGWFNDGVGSCGTARLGVTARLVNELDYEVAVGEVGELVVRHDDPWTLTSGYYRRPDATADANRNQWFHTGDAFYRDEEGNFFFVDRMNDSIRRRGENISSAEVEREVRKFDGVKEVAAIAAKSEFSEDEVRIVIVEEPGSRVDFDELFAFLETRMARYMLPRYMDVVAAIPKTETQKIQKNLLRAMPITEQTWEAPKSRARAGNPTSESMSAP